MKKEKDYVEQYLLTYKDTDAVRKRKIKIVVAICILLFVFCIFVRPVTRMQEEIAYNTNEIKKRNAEKKKFAWGRLFTNFETTTASRFPGQGNVIKVEGNLVYRGKYPLPVQGKITSNYGYRTSPSPGMHTGVDIQGKHHAEIISVEKGEVMFSGVQRGYGNCIIIRCDGEGETFYALYGHLSRRYVAKGQYVSRGQVIGLEGGGRGDPNPGYSTGHHLHFEVRKSMHPSSHVSPNRYIF